jgi:spermidine/putrescine transport system permease protein
MNENIKKQSALAHFRSKVLPPAVMVGPVALILLFLVLIPLVYVAVISFCQVDSGYNIVYQFTLKNYTGIFDPSYISIYINSLIIAFVTTLITLILAYPFAYKIARSPKPRKTVLYMLVILPFWTNSLIRIYGWRSILGTQGLFNKILMGIGITDAPAELLFTRGAVILGMVYTLFPFMVLPLYTAIEKLSDSLLEASSDLGAKPWKSFLTVTVPLTSAGIFSGSIMVFIPTLGYFFVADILGGGKNAMIGNIIEQQFQGGNNWPLGSALSILLIIITLLLVKIYQKMGGSVEELAL